MRVGFVSILDASDVTSWSGIPFQILQQMRKQGVDVRVLSPLRTKTKYLLAPLKMIAQLRNKRITLDHFQLVLRNYARQIEAFERYESVDVIFSPSTIPITLLKTSRPVVTWTDATFHGMHDYYDRAFADMTPSAIERGNWQEETALRNSNIAAFASVWALDGARRIADHSKLRVLPFGSSLPVTHTSDDVARNAWGKRAQRKNQCELLFVGVDWERKGGEIAVETARLLNEAGIETKLRIVGSTPKGDVPQFVQALGFINKGSEDGKKQMMELFRSADVFILPTKAEAAGIVFAEASSYGVPCVTYATGGVTDYVRSGVNGVCIEPGASAARFADEIRRMLHDPTEYQAYATRAFEEYKNRLNWERSVHELIGLCRQCAGAA